ncbi:MAG: ABC transporter substrate-binding protein [Hyphomicrobiaceae bacterium]|nr:ABC transporter substrate-binding protein [Hyphomicrobiaceae bacterium]
MARSAWCMAHPASDRARAAAAPDRDAGVHRDGARRNRAPGMARVLAALVLLAAAPGQGARADDKPQRIVSLDLCADQILIDLAPRSRIAAVTHLAADASVSAIPERARGLPVTRGAAEDVLKHDPDLVLAGQFGVAGTVSLLQRVGRKVVIVPLSSDLEGVRRAVTIVAAAVGEVRRGETLLAAFDARLAAVARAAATRGARRPSALVYQVGGSASLEGTLADAALVAAGFANASHAYPRLRGSQVPLEAILARPPDLLVLASPPFAYRTVVADNLRHPALRALAARIPSLELPWRQWLCGTPHLADAVEALAAAWPLAAKGAAP